MCARSPRKRAGRARVATASVLRFTDCEDRATKIGQIVTLAAGNKMAIYHNRRIFPNGAGVDEIILDAEGTGDAHATIDDGRNWNPAPMANRGPEFPAI